MHRPDGPASRGAILIVDEDPRIVELVSDMLRSAGYTPAQASSCAEAVELAAANGIDLAIADEGVCDARGRSVVARLRSRAPNLPVLVMSASIAADGCPPNVLSKPFHLDDLLRKVAGALRVHA